MKYRNPWIDPRIAHVRPDQARSYLLSRGWRCVGPADNPALEMFEAPAADDDTPAVLLPLQVDEGPMLQRMIELVADVARIEDRWAVDVLNDVLQSGISRPANGPAIEQPARSAMK
jgi:hypothetical protein